MGSRVFTHSDIINLAEMHSFAAGLNMNAGAVILGSDFGAIGISRNSVALSTSSNTNHDTLTQSGDIDLTRFPIIPDNVRIVLIEERVGLSFNVSLSLVTDTSGQQGVDSFFPEDGTTTFPYSAITPSAGSDVKNFIGTDTPTLTVGNPAIFMSLFGTPYCTKAQFESQFGSPTLLVDIVNLGAFISGIGSVSLSYNLQWTSWQYTVTWDESFQWELLKPDDPIQEGSSVEVISDPINPEALDFEQILTLNMEFLDENGDPQSIPITDWTLQDINDFIFVIPDFGVFTPGTVQFVITSTQFSGSVTLGRLITIYFLSATGIYTLVPGKANDTLYVEDNPGDTIDVKIPNPFFKTGYIGG